MRRLAILTLGLTLPVTSASAQPSGTALVRGSGAVASFRMDRLPVTNAEFLAFVVQHPAWRRDRVSRLFAEPTYLSQWASPDALGDKVSPRQPVVDVSWFAARAFCSARGMRLPTEAEWEYAAAASPTRPDGNADPAWRSELVSLYSRPSGPLPQVGLSAPNYWGIYDLHGVVWEWVDDFASSATSFRSGCGVDQGRADRTDFPAFQRGALRGSLRALYTLHNLGFRCAASS